MKLKAKRFIWSTLLIGFVVFLCNSSTVFSAVPEVINYQGSLSDNGGNPVNATLNITFTLYDDPVAGSTLWQETQPVTVTNGQFNVQLGADIPGNPLSPTIFEDPIFLGVQVDADAEMTPRQALTAVGYAFRSKTVENDTLNSLSCAADEIPKFNGSVWVCAADDSNTDTNAATICGAGTFLNGDGSCDTITDTNTNAATLCPNGTFLNGDGSCDVITDTNTTYSAGSGLSLNGTTFSIPTSGIDASHLATGSVGGLEIAPDAVGLSELSDLARGVGVSGVIVIPASAFHSSSLYGQSELGYVVPIGLNTLLCLTAPVNLPHGVTVTSFELSVWDNSVVRNIGIFRLRRVGFVTGTSADMGTVISSSSSPSVRVFTDNSISNASIDGFANSYLITGCITSDSVSNLNTRLYGARIRYN